MKNLSINLRGRVRNFNLPKNKALLPLLEAVVNGIHAIEERRETEEQFTDGTILIRIIRYKQMALEPFQPDIEGFTVEDDGIGFNGNNFNSFLESDSIYKMERGGKGVGRFSWLKAFEKAEIHSVFSEADGMRYARDFEFSLDLDEIDDNFEKCDKTTSQKTSITLSKCLCGYRNNLPREALIVAEKILHHCFIYFLMSNCPKITVLDGDCSFSLNEMFEETVVEKKLETCFDLQGNSFSLLHMKMSDKVLKGNKLLLCANQRVVEEKDLSKYIGNLDKKSFDDHNFFYVGDRKSVV